MEDEMLDNVIEKIDFSVKQILPNSKKKSEKNGFLVKLIDKCLGFDKINSIYQSKELCSNNTFQFLNVLLEKLGVNIKLNEKELERIPKDKSVILISNHPFGGLDGIILAKLLSGIRPDFKIMANSFLGSIREIKDLFIFVNPFKKNNPKNISPLREAIKWLKNDHLLAMFPSGEVSHFQANKAQITDPEWSQTVVKLLRKTEATIVPVYFKGSNSFLFQIIGCIHPFLRTIMLGRELINKKKEDIEIKIGRPIQYKNLSKIQSNQELTDYLRLRTYLLKEQLKEKKTNNDKSITQDQIEEIIEPVQQFALEMDIKSLPSSQKLLDYKEYSVYCANYGEIPFIIREIGRLREVTYREVGEGTNKSIDLDNFDKHYLHLFIWNNLKKEVVGAYRIGQLDKILEKSNYKNLYTSTLFKFNMQFLKTIPNALELGRSFIRKEYQRKHFSLFLLWKGICQFIIKNPHYRNLFGPVSISNDYQITSKTLIAKILTIKNKRVRARIPIKTELDNEINNYLHTYNINNLEDLNLIIKSIEPDEKDVPVLLKQYMKLGGKLISFNQDPEFNDALDGLIVVDLAQVPLKTLQLYMGNHAYQYLDYHFYHINKSLSVPA
jgi:putative hemolysin